LASYEQMYQALVVAHHDVVEFVRARVYTVAVLAGLTLTCWHPRLLAG
jgi:hypothetical protein